MFKLLSKLRNRISKIAARKRPLQAAERRSYLFNMGRHRPCLSPLCSRHSSTIACLHLFRVAQVDQKSDFKLAWSLEEAKSHRWCRSIIASCRRPTAEDCGKLTRRDGSIPGPFKIVLLFAHPPLLVFYYYKRVANFKLFFCVSLNKYTKH